MYDTTRNRRAGKALRAFRALRAMRPRKAVELFSAVGRVASTRTAQAGRSLVSAVARACRRVYDNHRAARRSDATAVRFRKRTVIARTLQAAAAGLLSVSLIPIIYALNTLLPEGYGQASSATLALLANAPGNALSRWMGKMADCDRLPYFVHQRLIQTVIRLYGVETHEIEKPLEHYHTVQEFFSRRLLPGARPPHPHAALVSPADCEILQVGCMDGTGGGDAIMQVKGAHYSASELLLTRLPPPARGFRRWYVLFHLRPKDYHRFHSAADWTVEETVTVPGALHPVTHTASKWIPKLFVQNERVVCLGKWQFGHFAMVPVGATCVGSISLGFDPSIRTNQTSTRSNVASLFRRSAGLDGASFDRMVEETVVAALPRCPFESADATSGTPPYGSREASAERWERSALVPAPLPDRSRLAVVPRGEGGAPSVFAAAPAPLRKVYEGAAQPHLIKGGDMGWFNWGSAIALVCDLPEGMAITARPLQEVRVGEPLCSW